MKSAVLITLFLVFYNAKVNANLDTGSGDVCRPVDPGEIRILPECSADEVFGFAFDCLSKWFSEYPYDDSQTCLNRLDSTISCITYKAYGCVSTDCPSQLDAIPGFREALPLIRDIIANITSFESILSLEVLNLDEPTIGYILYYVKEFACPRPGAGVPDLLNELLNSVITTDLNLNTLFGGDAYLLNNFFCDDDIIENLFQIARDFLNNWYGATDHGGICAAMDTLANAVHYTLNKKCDLTESAVRDFLQKVGVAITPEINEGLMYGFEFLQTFILDTFYFVLPNCAPIVPTNPPTTVIPPTDDEFNCEKYYYGTSSCERRKAWLCDYARWKKNTLVDWLDDFAKWSNNEYGNLNTADLPACDSTTELYVECTTPENKRCFYSNVLLCTYCYCSDHSYKDLSGLLDVWRKDYYAWRFFYQKYRTSSRPNNTC